MLSPNLELKVGEHYSTAVLDSDSQNHLRVLRIQSGETLSLLNGAGLIFESEMISKNEFRVRELIKKSQPQPEIHLFISLPKKDSLWEVIAQATELGVSKIIPIATQHNQNPQATRQKMAEKSQKIADEACCQCRQPFRVSVSQEWASLDSILKNPAFPMIYADEGTADQSSKPHIAKAKDGVPSLNTAPKLGLCIGPEGGWSESERQLLSSQALAMNLGPNVLRVTTATSVAIYHLRYFANC